MSAVDYRDSPYTWFGGKSPVSDIVWARFGNVPNYIEPFFGSGRLLFDRPDWHFTQHRDRIVYESVNDLDGYVVNFWRSVASNPEAVARHADRPVHEVDLHAVGDFLFCGESSSSFVDLVRSDHRFYDLERAGLWVWFVSNWIGAVPEVGLKDRVPRYRWNTSHRGVLRVFPGRKVNLSECDRRLSILVDWMSTLADRIRNVQCLSGDWSRICSNSFTYDRVAPCAVFLDPPYGRAAGRLDRLYSNDSLDVATSVLAWCVSHSDRQDLRIALCGYEGEHNILEGLGWDKVPWKAPGGLGNIGEGAGKSNAAKERIWFSPYCDKPDDKGFF